MSGHSETIRTRLAGQIAKFAIISIATLIASQIQATDKPVVRIGANSIWGEFNTYNMWQPTVDYLNQVIPEYRFELVPVPLDQIYQKVKNQEIDFITTNPGNYIELEADLGATRLLTLNKLRQGIPSTQFGAVIFTRADNKKIKTIYDLRGKSFAAVSKTAFGGFQMAWHELNKHGINPFKEFMLIDFVGFPQDKVVYAVRDGVIDAGTVRTDTLERMAKERLIRLSEFKILEQKTIENFPFLLSTQLYPEWPFVRLAHTSPELAKRITTNLLNLPANHKAARAAKSIGWTVPMDYHPVKELMQTLKVGPYEKFDKITLVFAFKKYWWLVAIFILSIAPPVLAYIRRLQNRAHMSQKIAIEEAEWNHAMDFVDEPICMMDLDGRLIRANRIFFKIMDTSWEKAIGYNINLFCHPMDIDAECPVCMARQTNQKQTITLEAGDAANKLDIPVEISFNQVKDSNNQAVAIIQTIRDLTNIRVAESAIRQNESRLRGLLNATPDPLLIVNEAGEITLINQVFEKQFGYTAEEIIGNSVDILVPDAKQIDHTSLRKSYLTKPVTRPKVFGLALHCLHKQGHKVPVEISLSPVETDDGILISVSLRDITERIESEKELNRLASFPEHSPIPIIEFNGNGQLSYVNPIARRSFPELEKSNGQHNLVQDILNIKHEIMFNHEMMRDIEINSAIYEQKITYSPEHDLFRVYFWDITKIRDMTRQMAYQATHDSLTRLINRAEFELRLEQALQSVDHEDKQHVLCYMDLDQFKIVNDTCGHIAGDELLKQISSLLLSNLRESDTLARLGGDEFGLLLTGCPVNTARNIADKLRTSVENYRFSWKDKSFKIGMSIGLVPVLEKGLTVSELLSSADTACYIAKEHGRNRIHTYNSQDKLSAKHTNEMNWVHRLHKALEEEQFELYVQQILNLANPSHLYYEVLIRMKNEDGEIVPPLAFLPAAERYGLIAQIDTYIIEKTLQAFSEPDLRHIHLSINLSGQTLSDHNIMNYIIRAIDKYNIDASRLTFEVTETAMVANLSDAIRFISTLRGLGCRFALDDFGSGFSSFAYLKNLPVDIIKIDGGFVRDMLEDPVNSVMVESMIYIGHNMQLKTVAEFVENTDILNALQEMGIDFAQGYGVAQPIALSELQSILKSNHSGSKRA